MRATNLHVVRPLNEGDLELLLLWRNNPSVRSYMYTQHEISVEEHKRWFKQESQNPQKYLLVFEINRSPLGFINIHELRKGGSAEWGFYTAPNAPKGTGRALGISALRYAFETIKLHKICGKALAFNKSSIRFHLSLGFQQEGVLRQQQFDGKEYHDVYCFGLLANDWLQAN